MLKIPGLVSALKARLIAIEAGWFDRTRNVKTSGDADISKLTLVGRRKEGYPYLPVRPSAGRQSLRALEIKNYAEYTFIDFGSGKGRMLLLAAEYPFGEVQGVEFATELHDIAQQNLQAVRRHRVQCGRIGSNLMDAVDYTFPPGNLVIHFFNPFGPEIMAQVLDRLDGAIESTSRDVRIIMMFPENAFLFEDRQFRIYRKSRRFLIYRRNAMTPANPAVSHPAPKRSSASPK